MKSVDRLLGMVAELQTQVREMRALLGESVYTLSPDANAAVRARFNAKARGFFLVPEFAAVTGHSSRWVSDGCAARVIRTLPGKRKPFRIPLAEEHRWVADETQWKGGL